MPRAILKGDAAVLIALPPKPRKGPQRGGSERRAGSIRSAIRCSRRCATLRRELAQEAGRAALCDLPRCDLARDGREPPRQPCRQLGEIGGVGARKLEAYGEAFLAVIRQHLTAGSLRGLPQRVGDARRDQAEGDAKAGSGGNLSPPSRKSATKILTPMNTSTSASAYFR